jgi:NAD(P)-dependent dehydrogenase (short-subunit alcohol dehydrogenase family)
MPDQSASGKHSVITGGTSGVGLETARLMVAAGGDVFIVGSDPEKGRRAERAAMPHSSGPTSRRWKRFVD